MQVKITKIVKENAHPHYSLVEFETSYGSAIAYWYGSSPNVEQYYDVELEIQDSLVWNETVVEIVDQDFLLNYLNESLILQGRIELITDETVDLRIGDSIITFTSKGKIPIQNQSSVKIYAKNVVLFNTNL